VTRDNGEPDEFVRRLVDGLTKDIYVWRMSSAMVHSSNFAQHKSAVTRMRNAEARIRETAFGLVESERLRQAMRGLPR
jgi:hypothetical protein